MRHRNTKTETATGIEMERETDLSYVAYQFHVVEQLRAFECRHCIWVLGAATGGVY